MARSRWRVRWAAAIVTGVVAVTVVGCSSRPEGQYLGAAAVPPPSATESGPSASATPTVTGRWWSGASGDQAADGSFGRWRHAAIQIAGTWDNGNDVQVTLPSICRGGPWARWNKPLDIAIGAIDQYQGETWAAAAKGAYDSRWRRSFARMKACWGSRNPANLYIRFAHEMNLQDLPWHVKGGQEANFVTALKRYSDLRYTYLPKANIVLCPSDGTDERLGLDLHKLWPGKDAKGRPVVNVYAIDTYNGYSVVKTAEQFEGKLTAEQSGIPFGMELHREFAEAMGVPFAVSEWSNNGDPKDAGKGGEAPEYVRQMNAWFREHAGDPSHPRPGVLLYEVHYNLLPQFQFLPTKFQPKTAAMYRSLTWGH